MKLLINNMQVKATYELNNFIKQDGRIVDKESIQGVILTLDEFNSMYEQNSVKFIKTQEEEPKEKKYKKKNEE